MEMNNWNHLCIPENVVITALISDMGFNSCISYYYCKTTNFSVLLILAILANGIKALILIPANIYNQSRGRTR